MLKTIVRKSTLGTLRFFRKQLQLRPALAHLERDLRAGARPSEPLLRQLVGGWSNRWYSANTNLLDAILDWLPKTSGPILECGSGLSTLLLAAAAAQSGRTVISLENNAAWACRVLSAVPAHLRPYASVKLAPIGDFGDFEWYSVKPEDLPSSIGLVICDGPPGTTRGGRYGLAPVLARSLAAGCIVILDDAQRPGEREVMQRWQSDFRATVVQEQSTYVAIRVGGQQPAPGCASSQR